MTPNAPERGTVLGTVCCHQSVPQKDVSHPGVHGAASSRFSSIGPPYARHVPNVPLSTPDQRVAHLFQHRAAVKGQKKATCRPKPSVVIRRSEHHDNLLKDAQFIFGLRRRSRVVRAACVHAGCGKRECLRAHVGKRRRACLVPCGASRRERGHRGVQTPGCRPASGNSLQARQCSGRSARGPRCAANTRRCSVSRLRHIVRTETRPRAIATSSEE
jgi:hypothetical protein